MWRISQIQAFVILICMVFLGFVLFSINLQSTVVNDRITLLFKNDCSVVDKKVSVGVEELPCLIEASRRVACFKKDGEIFMPFFKFIQKQFDVTGKLDRDHFEYYTSYSEVRIPESTIYNPLGSFGHFASYNVEVRERVRCISAEYGVPMSVQWNKIPYFYPIQIAQYALQHYSRFKIEQEVRVHRIFQFKFSNGVKSENSAFGSSKLVHFTTERSDSLSATLILQGDTELTNLIFSWLPKNISSWFCVELEFVKTGRPLTLKYKFVADERCVWIEPDYDEDYDNSKEKLLSFVYSMGVGRQLTSNFSNVLLDLDTDVLKAMSSLEVKKTLNLEEINGGIRLKTLNFYGSASVLLPLRQQNTADLEKFNRAAEWFVTRQNELGGWPVPVRRSISDDRIILEAGWHSAMAQGHAISVLVRAQSLHPHIKLLFVNAIKRSLKLFYMNANESGVVNRLFGNDWFEEYPTTPGIFVLNGFIYSLIGIHDATVIPELSEEAAKLFQIGISSLKKFLPLFDSGSRSFYDLRHLALKTAPNLARWDYHAVHIYLLKWLFNITGEKQFNDVAERWIDYAHGKMAKHN